LRANRATDINAWRQLVGFGTEGNPRGFTWRDGVLYDLEELVDPPMVLANHTPWAINERGVIAGQRHDYAIVLFPQAPPGDIDIDCRVDLKDLLLLLFDFGCTGEECVGDVNQDGQTSLPDLAILLSNWNP
jgi:probable HAF family extracellular repeat protein